MRLSRTTMSGASTSASTSACSSGIEPHAEMKPTLQFRLSQHLTLTPQLQQSIRLLQLSTVELNQEIERLLMENPALEREDHDEPDAAPPAGGTSSSVATEAAPAPDTTDWSADVASNWRTGGDDEDNDRNF